MSNVPTGKGGDCSFPVFNALPIDPTTRGHTGGKNHALYPALDNRKFPCGKDLNIKTPCTAGTIKK